MGPLIIPTGVPIDKATVAETGVQMQMPFRLGSTERNLWLLPYEPLVAVRMRNVITRRLIAKMKKGGFGSVKESWAKDDYEILISGMLHNASNPNELPIEQITRLDSLCSSGEPLITDCALLAALGISQIVPENLEFPPTPGIGYQAYTLRAFSDSNFNLLIEK